MKIERELVREKICVVGLGYVGLTLAVTMAEAGFQVIGIEKNDEVKNKLRAGQPHFFETGLDRVLERVLENGQFKIAEDISSELDVFIITVGTPLDENGEARLDMVQEAAAMVAEQATSGALVIMRSTLKLGTTRELIFPVLSKRLDKFDLAFCPERTLEGQALKELLSLPQIVGGINQRSTIRAANLFQMITPTVVRVSSPEAAEMIKLVDNSQRDVAFAYSNEVAMICDESDVSALEVIRAGKLGYPRTNLFMPGPVGGPCLSKDPHILAEGARQRGVVAGLTLMARKVNESQPEQVAQRLKKLMLTLGISTPKRIALCGLAFKGRPATDDLRGTVAIDILREIKSVFPMSTYVGYDPMVGPLDIAGLGLTPVESLDDAFAESELVLILNNHPQFEVMDIGTLSRLMAASGFIYDFWGQFDPEKIDLPNSVGYGGLGFMAHAKYPIGKGE